MVAVQRISIFPLAIPLRGKVTHAGAQREVADPVVIAVELDDGTIGYGETLPRPYVTDETADSVVEAVRERFAAVLADFRASSFPDALEAVEALPWRTESGRLIPAARAAVELALLDALMRHYRRGIDDVAGWMGLPGFGTPGSVKRVRFSGVLAAEDIERTLRQLRWMYWGGLRHFKLKVGVPRDRRRAEEVAAYLKRPIAKGRATLRVDANGAWSKDEALDWLGDTSHLPIASVEQPLARGEEDCLPSLRGAGSVSFMHDESLITMDDAQRLLDLGVADGFNIRVSKCGGLMPSLRLAALARRANVRIQLGCMVGETSILSAAAVRFLQVCPAVVWAEGCFGTFLLGSDVVAKSLRFGYGGRPPRVHDHGLGVRVHPEALRLLCEDHPVVLHL
jgi:muconate cycloisomerase